MSFKERSLAAARRLAIVHCWLEDCNLSTDARLLLNTLLTMDYLQGMTGEVVASNKYLSEVLGLKVHQMEKARKALSDAGIIEHGYNSKIRVTTYRINFGMIAGEPRILDELNGGRLRAWSDDNAGDDETATETTAAPIELIPTTESGKAYKCIFGSIDTVTYHQLAQLESRYTMIELVEGMQIAYKNKVTTVKYIVGVMNNRRKAIHSFKVE